MRTLDPIPGAATLLIGCTVLCTAGSVARCDEGFGLLLPDSLVISASSYDRAQGAVASLKVGTTLPNTATATTTAIADNSYVNVWNNESADASFGLTSPIRLLDVDPRNGRVFRAMTVPPNEVVTSFSSKS